MKRPARICFSLRNKAREEHTKNFCSWFSPCHIGEGDEEIFLWAYIPVQFQLLIVSSWLLNKTRKTVTESNPFFGWPLASTSPTLSGVCLGLGGVQTCVSPGQSECCILLAWGLARRCHLTQLNQWYYTILELYPSDKAQGFPSHQAIWPGVTHWPFGAMWTLEIRPAWRKESRVEINRSAPGNPIQAPGSSFDSYWISWARCFEVFLPVPTWIRLSVACLQKSYLVHVFQSLAL